MKVEESQLTTNDLAYMAGLFDGEGSVYFKKTKQIRHKRKGKPVHNVTVIRMEISMTDEEVIKWFHDMAGCGTVGKRKFKSEYAKTWKQQWRWRCCSRDAYFMARALWPYVKVKLPKIEEIIDHYERYDGNQHENVVDLDHYRTRMKK
jgi:hypothetical protein